MQNRGKWRAKVLYAADQIGLVNIVRGDVEVGEFANELGHGRHVVVDAA